jgi:hypothetical protein
LDPIGICSRKFPNFPKKLASSVIRNSNLT